jgi:FlaA1/EpsC-like NDP-sugar epimerase
MTIPEAVQLVIQAGALAEGGEIFILDMGEPVKIMELAENLIRLSGFTPHDDIEIRITQLRPGEKLHEELILEGEQASSTRHEKIFVGKPLPPSEELKKLLDGEPGPVDAIYSQIVRMNDEQVKDWLHTISPAYQAVRKKTAFRGVIIQD